MWKRAERIFDVGCGLQTERRGVRERQQNQRSVKLTNP
jgi:hypothetical protein